MKPQSDSELLREKRSQIKDLETNIPAKYALLEIRKMNLEKQQKQLHDRKIQIENVKA